MRTLGRNRHRRFVRVLLPFALLLSLAPAGVSSAASTNVVHVSATRSGCGPVRLTQPGRLDLAAALRPVSRGYRAIYVRQVRPTEPIDLIGVRSQPIAHRSTPETMLLGAVGVTFPAGQYRLCVVTDTPVAFDIPSTAVRGRVAVTLRPARSKVQHVIGVASSLLLEHGTATAPVTTTRSSVVFVAGLVRLPAAAVSTYDFGTCLVRRTSPCDHGDPTYGTGHVDSGSGGASEIGWEYWTDSEAGPGSFDAGVTYSGTRRLDQLRGFVLTLDL